MLPIETEAGLILPGHPDFEAWLHQNFPPDWGDFAYSNPDFAFVVRSDSRILEAVSHEEMEEYIEGGEYDELLDGMDNLENE